MEASEFLAEHAQDDYCDLTTTGRRTGNPHKIEIWFGVIGGTMYLISGNGPSADWFRNALIDPAVVVDVGGRTFTAQARAVVDVDERRHVGDVMGEKYTWDGDDSIGLTRHAWCYEVPVLAISEWSDR